jgi:hypothetical protein
LKVGWQLPFMAVRPCRKREETKAKQGTKDKRQLRESAD